jgi:hypothetical protein
MADVQSGDIAALAKAITSAASRTDEVLLALGRINSTLEKIAHVLENMAGGDVRPIR